MRVIQGHCDAFSDIESFVQEAQIAPLADSPVSRGYELTTLQPLGGKQKSFLRVLKALDLSSEVLNLREGHSTP